MPINTTLPDWLATGVQPPESLRTNGWEEGQKPAAEYFNWFFSTSYYALKDLAENAASQQDLDNHKNNQTNPHQVTKSQVGLSNVDDVKQASKTEFDSHTQNNQNPHSVTAAQVGASPTGHGHSTATTTTAGFMSGVDKTKLNNIPAASDVETKAGATQKADDAEATAINWAKSYGVGTYAKRLDIHVDNAPNGAGFFYVLNGTVNGSPTGANGYLIQQVYTVDYKQQLFFEVTTNRIHQRFKDENGWNSWKELETTDGAQAKADGAEAAAIDYAQRFGLGDWGQYTSDANKALSSGFWVADNTTLNMPNNNYFAMFVNRPNASACTQIALSRNSAANGEMFYRNMASGVWNPWVQVETTAGAQAKADAVDSEQINVISEKVGSDSPSSYPVGISVFDLNSGTSGFPGVLGTVVTNFISENRGYQNYYEKNGSTWYRTADLQQTNGWSPWKQIANAEKFVHKNQLTTNNDPYGKVPIINGDGVMEIGRYLDFHFEDDDGATDYHARAEVLPSNEVNFTHGLKSKGKTAETTEGAQAKADAVQSWAEGLGLGSGASNTLPSGTDLNTVVDSGFYRLSSNHPNSPTGVDYSQMIVMHGGGDTIAQIIVDYNPPLMHIRAGNPSNVNGAGSWEPWLRQAGEGRNVSFNSISANDNIYLNGGTQYKEIGVKREVGGNETNVSLSVNGSNGNGQIGVAKNGTIENVIEVTDDSIIVGGTDLKQSVSNGKQQVRDAVIGKGGSVADGDGDGIPTFQELTDGVNEILTNPITNIQRGVVTMAGYSRIVTISTVDPAKVAPRIVGIRFDGGTAETWNGDETTATIEVTSSNELLIQLDSYPQYVTPVVSFEILEFDDSVNVSKGNTLLETAELVVTTPTFNPNKCMLFHSYTYPFDRDDTRVNFITSELGGADSIIFRRGYGYADITLKWVLVELP
ncbi:pyocin knob domain-containing protein [Halobacillus sp. SY10]|uniref:pyocin knob domain-containing protein n=1 Tax=Halobacillus sp. SY10 TaxID=3381356 RepID=UPI003879BF3B